MRCCIHYAHEETVQQLHLLLIPRRSMAHTSALGAPVDWSASDSDQTEAPHVNSMSLTVAVCLGIFLLSALLYDHLTKRIPTRLRADQAPKSELGLRPATGDDLPTRPNGMK